MRKALIGVITGVLIGGFVFGGGHKEEIKKVELLRTVNKSEQNLYLDEGEVFYEFTDGSWVIINENKNTYVFQPEELGDWSYELNNKDELENVVKTYLSIKNTGSY